LRRDDAIRIIEFTEEIKREQKRILRVVILRFLIFMGERN